MDGPEKLARSLRGFRHFTITEATLYVLFAGLLWLALYVLLRRRFRSRRLSVHEPTAPQIAREIVHSLRSLVIFGLVTGGAVFAIYSGWTQMYRGIDSRGWTWWVLSFAIVVLVHDTYFYWTHRLMHHRRLYRLFHRTHHLSINPTPWAAYAFSPLEALVQAGIGPLVVFTIPMHSSVFMGFMVWQIAFNVFGHCGYELWPKGFLRTWLGWILNTPTHHALHHEKFRENYGLYFNVWDRLMATNHRLYEQRFAEATDGKIAASAGPIKAPSSA
ncbi:MAG TPA: sterol desaturase family protein [Pirellulales bacterium]|jgi:sterol desaturase/sphingolipid hydroxylase (fatty acid hydroxylase superfamily)|nr:sterol desaturase family protein [Pirellulales bacterium]